jgi:membrane-associated phospholipid phosphatase
VGIRPSFVYQDLLFVDPAKNDLRRWPILVENQEVMKNKLCLLLVLLSVFLQSQAQVLQPAGSWPTWFISSGKEYRLPMPAPLKGEAAVILAKQKQLDEAQKQQIDYWGAGAPNYRWQQMMTSLWIVDTGRFGSLANLIVGVGTYDAMVAAWDTKYSVNRPRPFMADKRIAALGGRPASPSYPCEYSVAAGVAATVIAHFYPKYADSVARMASQMMEARVASGLAYPSDTKDGFELGKRIALKEIEHTGDWICQTAWDGKMPEGAGFYKGKFAMLPMAGHNKTAALDSASQFRPGPPPDFSKDMAELKNFKQGFRSMSNALFYASNNFWDEVLNKKIFEHRLQDDPPAAARVYALTAITNYDAFAACWDAKYTYWGIRPNQFDTSYKSLVPTPPFPGYPSGHAALSSALAELYAYLFPTDAAWFRQKAKDVAESRFQAGIHFRTDNEVALELGKKVAAQVISKDKTKTR